MNDAVLPARTRRMPSAPRARGPQEPREPREQFGASTPTADAPAPEATAATTEGSRPGLGLRDLPRPDRIGRYRVVGTLGQGGVGVVYEGLDDSLGRPVAIKVLRDRSDDNIARFRREARAMSRVNHPNVVAVYEVNESTTQSMIVMELVRGQSLRRWLEGSRSVEQIAGVIRQAGEGLAAAHQVGLIHRDIKPDNIVVGDDGRVRVVDFGLAKHRSELDDAATFDRDALARELADAGITRTGKLMGTPAYMAPEQFHGQGEPRSDQFALCVVLYEALFGVRPFEGETAEDLFEATSRGHMRSWPTRHDVPAELKAVLRRGLSSREADRYPSMGAFLDALGGVHTSTVGDRPRHRTRGMRSWKWRIAGAATGLLLAAMNAAMSSSNGHDAIESRDVQATVSEPEVVSPDDRRMRPDDAAQQRRDARAEERASTRPTRPAQS